MIPVVYQGQNEYNVLFIEKQNISQGSDVLCCLERDCSCVCMWKMFKLFYIRALSEQILHSAFEPKCLPWAAYVPRKGRGIYLSDTSFEPIDGHSFMSIQTKNVF